MRLASSSAVPCCHLPETVLIAVSGTISEQMRGDLHVMRLQPALYVI